MSKEEKIAKEKMYVDAICWICSTTQRKITKEEFFNWIENTGHNRAFKGKYCGGANKIKEALLNRSNLQQSVLIVNKLLF